MASIASLGRAVSGLQASQMGLQVTGHNLTNLNTQGYTRQQLLVHDSSYMNIGSGGSLKQVGMGVSLTEIRQIRDEFVDKRLRTQTSVLNFYDTKQSALTEVETILDEPYGETLSGMMEDFWGQAQKLSTNPAGVEERLSFIQTADVLLKRANQIFDGLTTYQHHLNTQIKDSVGRINDLTQGIKDLNDIIAKSEINGDNANDYRDQRNLLLDELSQYIDISYTETADGRVKVKGNGHDLVDGQFVTEIKMTYADNGSGFVTPIWGDTGAPVFDLNREINSSAGGDKGKLLGLLVARGDMTAGSDTPWSDIAINDNKSVDADGNSFLIPKIQKQIAELMDGIVSMTNDVLTGKGIDGNAGLPVFVPISGADGKPMTEQQLSNLYQMSADSLATMLEDLPEPKIGMDEDGNVYGTEEYLEAMEKHEAMMDAYKAYSDASPDDPDFEALKAAHEMAVAEYEAAVTDYEAAVEGKELVLDGDLSEAYHKANDRADSELKVLFTADNMQVNPELLKEGGYNHLGTVAGDSGDIGDNSIVTEFLDEWSKPRGWPDENSTDPSAPIFKESSFDDFYAELVSGIGTEGYEYSGKVMENNTLVNSTMNERLAMSSVSQDEELSNMLKYQYAYNASARMISVLDGMMDQVINRM